MISINKQKLRIHSSLYSSSKMKKKSEIELKADRLSIEEAVSAKRVIMTVNLNNSLVQNGEQRY